MLCGSLVLNVEASLSVMGDLFILLLSYLPSATTSYVAWIADPQCWRTPAQNGRSFDKIVQLLTFCHHFMCCVDRWSSMLKKACPEWAIFSYDCLGTYLLPPIHMLCGSLVLNVEESLFRMGDLNIWLFRYYLLPTFWSSLLKNARPEWAILW